MASLDQLISSNNTVRGVLTENTALVVLAQRQAREIKFLRTVSQDDGSSTCPICFRDYPHGVEAHASDDYHKANLPETLRNET